MCSSTRNPCLIFRCSPNSILAHFKSDLWSTEKPKDRRQNDRTPDASLFATMSTNDTTEVNQFEPTTMAVSPVIIHGQFKCIKVDYVWRTCPPLRTRRPCGTERQRVTNKLLDEASDQKAFLRGMSRWSFMHHTHFGGRMFYLYKLKLILNSGQLNNVMLVDDHNNANEVDAGESVNMNTLSLVPTDAIWRDVCGQNHSST